MNKRDWLEDITAHLLAGTITLGFFATVLIALLGYVDLQNSTTASLVGIVMGYVAGSINPVLNRYFKGQLVIPTSTQGTEAPPEQPRQSDKEPPP